MSAAQPIPRSPVVALTARLADFVAHSRFEDIPNEVVRRAKLSFADSVGAMLIGSLEPGPRILADFVRDQAARASASVIGHGFKTSPQDAAWVNGTAADVLGLADFSLPHMNHPSAAICPTVLALGEDRAASGRDVLHAYILGVEVSNKVAQGVKPGLHKKGWHALGVCNTFGAAAAAAKLVRLDGAQTANAFGIAGGEASGIKASMVTMTKSYVAGAAARNGICAALLTARGFTGPADVFEARDGFLQTFGDGVDGSAMLHNLASPWEFEAPGLTLKSYPSCTHTHTGIHATLALKRKHAIEPDQVESVLCSVSPVVYDFLAWTDPQNRLEAKFSMQYCVATALIAGQVEMANFRDQNVRAPHTRALMQRIKMVVSPELAKLGYNPSTAPAGCTVEIKLKDGRVLTLRQDKGPWEPETPPSWEALMGKFRHCAAARMDAQATAHADRLLAEVEALANVATLMDIVRC